MFDYDIPVMYQDLGTYSMNPFGGVSSPMQTSYLEGAKMQPPLENDKVELINKKEQEGKKTLKKAVYILGALLLIGFIPHFRKQIIKSGGLGKYIKNCWNALTTSVKNVFNPTPKTTMWQKFKNIFKRKP